MISNLKYDIEFRREKALELSSQVEQHIAAGGRFSKSKAAPINPAPAQRSDKIDPETVLKRKPLHITRAQRRIFRQLAEAL
ncbi:MAG: hypothetical protein JWP42_4341 [Pseudomonas sp.]|nr:hypothetical protein [Pseudomonas sp.]